MARVTPAELQEIYDVDSSIDTDAYITAANLIVNNNLVGTSLDAATLKEIERWLAVHAISIMNRSAIAASEKAGSVGESVQFKLGLNLTPIMMKMKNHS